MQKSRGFYFIALSGTRLDIFHSITKLILKNKSTYAFLVIIIIIIILYVIRIHLLINKVYDNFWRD